MYLLVRNSIISGAIILLTACVSSLPVIEDVAIESSPEPEQITVEPLPLTSELVYYILMAEVAGQRGEIGVAAELYNRAAIEVDSVALASRSTQVANFSRDKSRIKRALKRWNEVDPTDADIYIMQAPFMMIEGDHDGVVESVNTAINLSPDKTAQFLAQIADNLSELVTQKQALSVLQKLESYQQQDVEALFTYARLAQFYKLYDEALTTVEMVLQQQPEREDAQILKAEALQRLGQGDAALAILKGAATKKDASNELRFAYAKLLGENNKTTEARTVFEQLYGDNPKNEEILFALGLLALEEKNGTTAKKYFTQLLALGDPGKQAAYFMGLSEELNEDIDAALVWYAAVVTESSRFQASQSRYVNLLANKGQLDKARLHLQLLRKEHPAREVQYYIFEAAFLREQDQQQAAFDLYSEALKGFPNEVELLYGRAMTAEGLDRLTVLEEDLRHILSLNPDNDVVLNALGYTLTDRTDRHQEALELIEKAISIRPDDPFYLDSLGWVYYRLGDLDKALRYLKQAVDIQDDVEFIAHLGEVLWQQGQKEEAKQVWQQGLQQTKDNELLNETMRRFGQ